MSVFHSDWWLDIVSQGNSWGISTIEENNLIIARLPWVLRTNSFGHRIIYQPPLTQTLGPYFDSSVFLSPKYANNLTKQHRLLSDLFSGLPFHHYFHQHFSPDITNWLPLYWSKYSQTTKYTYRIQLDASLDLWQGYQDKVRTDVRKASKILSFREDSDIKAFFHLLELTFDRQNLRYPYDNTLLESLMTTSLSIGNGRLFFAFDASGSIHSGAFIVFDKETAYYLLGGSDPNLRNSGSMSYLLHSIIPLFVNVSSTFDFEGSMIRNIERFVRGFGAIQTPYFSVSKFNSRSLQTYSLLKSVAKIWLS